MNSRNIGVLSWVAVAAAVAAWAGVFMYSSWISSELDARSAQTADVQSVSEREIAALRVHSLVRDTEIQRAQLDTLMNTDVISVANMIEGIGSSAGVQLKIGAATPETVVQKKGAGKTTAPTIVGFVVEADGSFAAVMRAAALLESLPVLSSVQNLEFENVMTASDAKSVRSTWHLTARVRVLISSNI